MVDDRSDEVHDTVAHEPGPDAPQASVETMLDHVRELRAQQSERRGLVAAGGMAEVFAIDDASLGRRAAMKVLMPALAGKPQAVARFITEAQITAQLDHPNIVPVQDLGVDDDGRPFFTMKLVEGKTLQELVNELPPGPVERDTLLDLLGVVLKACDALAFAHAKGVVHADIKPSNVMVGDFGQVYLMDWGISRLEPAPGETPADEDARERVQSWVSTAMPGGWGSPNFIPPEQGGGDDPTVRSDVFGVGTLVYYVLARRPPYQAETLLDTLSQAVEGKVAPILDVVTDGRVPLPLRRVLDRALAFDPRERYADIASLQADLTRFVRGGGEYPMVTFRPDQTIIRQGEKADAAYVIVGGRCEVFTEAGGERTVHAQLGRGDVFGETAILANSARTASVRAVEQTTVVRIPVAYFERELDDMKPWMGAFTRALAQRFRDQLERATAAKAEADAAPPKPHPDFVLFYLAIWAGEQEGDRRTIALSELTERLSRRYTVDERDVERAVSGSPYVRLSTTAEHVTVTNLKRLSASLHSSFSG